MIIVDVFGGLGNQMFQYAAAYRLALLNNTELVISTYGLKHDKKRRYALAPFWINNHIVDFYIPEASSLKKYMYGIPGKIDYYEENIEFEFDAGLLEKNGHICLRGYWQNPRYFEDIREVIQSIFSLRSPSLEFLKHQSMLRSTTSVGMHIRRGDFLSDAISRHKHDICNLEYYKHALDRMRAQIGIPFKLYIFSDDLIWSRQHFSEYPDVQFIQLNSDAEDLMLMSECQHNIISNSTYSWWAAWLNKHPGKIVIAPDPWLKNTHLPYHNILPDSWHKLKVKI